jgi:hypothetical protein
VKTIHVLTHAAIPPPGFSPVFYTQITNGDEQPDERLAAVSGHEATRSCGFSNREVHRLDVPDSLPSVQWLSRKPPSSSVRATDQSGQQQWRADRLRGWRSQDTPEPFGKDLAVGSLRTAKGDNKPSKRIKRSALCTWRPSRRHPVLRRLQIVLHERAVLIPSHSLPGLLKGRRGDRGHQNPFQGLFSSRRLLFPHPNGPYFQRFFAEPLDLREVPTRSRGQRRAAPRSSGPFVHDWQAPGTVGWLAQAKCAQNRADTFALPLLARSVDSQTLAPENGFASRGLPERTETYRRHDLPHARWWSRGESSQARDQAHPDIGLSFSPLSSLASRFCCWGSCAYKRLLHRASQHLPALGQDGQHRLQIQPSSSLIAAPLPSPWLWDDGRGPLRWCPEPAARGVSSQSARVSVANEAASVRELVTSSSSSSRYKAIVSFQVCMWAGKDAEACSAMRVAAFTARAVRRISLSLLGPKVFFAQHSAFRRSCVFIFLF